MSDVSEAQDGKVKFGAFSPIIIFALFPSGVIGYEVGRYVHDINLVKWVLSLISFFLVPTVLFLFSVLFCVPIAWLFGLINERLGYNLFIGALYVVYIISVTLLYLFTSEWFPHNAVVESFISPVAQWAFSP